MSRVCGSVYDQGSITGLDEPVPLRLGFSPAWPCCHSHQRRSMFAWCIQKIGSAGAVEMKPIVPPTQTWTAPCTASRLEVNGVKVPFPITVGMFEAIVVRSAVVPGERVTVIGASGGGIETVGVKPVSHGGALWSFS